jgi:DNA-binding IclR family transcriptional regulator
VSTSERVLGVIDLFTVEEPQWTIDGIAARLQLARTTAYRYTRTLVDVGFLASLNAGSYVLGPRLIALDRQIRLSDPMLRAAVPIMAALRKQAQGVQQLCSYYGDQVMCVHHETSDDGPDTTVERGRPYPQLAAVQQDHARHPAGGLLRGGR